jgi:hypothetical protein
MNGWWIYVSTAAVSILSKHVIKLGGRHIFNPSNFGLVLCFLVLGERRAEPLDFWWGPMDAWMVVALAIIVGGGFAILTRLKLLHVAVAFWVTFAAGLGLLTVTGHAMSARWHIGPVTDAYFWWVLVTSPEILVFLFFMISDPKTIPASRRGRIAYAVAVGVLATILIAASKTEFWAKVAVLGALTVVCLAWPLLKRWAPRLSVSWPKIALAGAAVLALWGAGIVTAGIRARPEPIAAPLAHTGRLPALEIGKSTGVSGRLDRKTAQKMASDLIADLQLQERALAGRDTTALARTATFARLPELRKQVWAAAGRPIVVPSYRLDHMAVHYSPGAGQGAAVAVARLKGTQQLTTYLGPKQLVVRRERPTPYRQAIDLQLAGKRWLVARIRGPHAVPKLPGPSPIVLAAAQKELAGVRLTNVAKQVGLDFRQGAFRFGVTADPPAYMGGGVCWLDYDNDGWMDLFVVNSYGEGDVGPYFEHGGLPRSTLYRNVHGRFRKVWVTPTTRGEGCVAADLDGDGRTDLYVTSALDDQLFWNDGYGRFTKATRKDGIASSGWHSGAAVADVNGDGRPDLYVGGYTENQGAIPGSSAGFPSNHLGVRDKLFLNLGHRRFKDVGANVGLDPSPFDHSLGAVFTDLNKDGRADLVVANDEDPNRAYLNVKGGSLGFHLVDNAKKVGLADPNAGMGVAVGDLNFASVPTFLFVTNSRGQEHAVYRAGCSGEDCELVDARRQFAQAFGTNFTGWGDTFADLANSGTPQLVLANGDIPVKDLAKNAGVVQVIAKASGNWLDASGLVGATTLPRVNGRGVAAADFDNDGHVDLAVGSVGGKLMLLRSTGGSGHWLEVNLKPYVPGAIVTVYTPRGSYSQEAHAGSSYLSSEDPRLHFGLGTAQRILDVEVKLPGGRTIRAKNVPVDRLVTVATG